MRAPVSNERRARRILYAGFLTASVLTAAAILLHSGYFAAAALLMWLWGCFCALWAATEGPE